MEIIDNSRELKGFKNLEEDIKLVGYFKSHKSERKNLYWDSMLHVGLRVGFSFGNNYTNFKITKYELHLIIEASTD